MIKRIKSFFRKKNANKVEMVYTSIQPNRNRKIPMDLGKPFFNGAGSSEAIRAQVRYAEKNNPYVVSILDSFVNNVIGDKGVQIKPLPLNEDGKVNEYLAGQIKRHWAFFLRSATAQGFTFSQVQRGVCRQWLRDGEVFIQHLDHYYKNRNVPYMIQVVDADMVVNTSTDNNVVCGIKLGEFGEKEGFYIQSGANRPTNIGFKTNFFPADKMFQVAYRTTLSQVRGVSKLAPVLNDLQDLNDYEAAEQVKAKMAASVVFVIKKDDTGDDLASYVEDSDEDEDDKQVKKKIKLIEETEEMTVAPGMSVNRLKPGESIDVMESKSPSGYIAGFVKNLLQKIAGGVGGSPSTITKEYEGSYSSRRQESIDTWRGYNVLQNELACQFLMPIYNRFMQNLLENRVLNIPATIDMENITNANYVFPVAPWIDPLKEAMAQKVMIETGTDSRTRTITANGKDPKDIFSELNEELKQEFVKKQGENNAKTQPIITNDDE